MYELVDYSCGHRAPLTYTTENRQQRLDQAQLRPCPGCLARDRARQEAKTQRKQEAQLSAAYRAYERQRRTSPNIDHYTRALAALPEQDCQITLSNHKQAWTGTLQGHGLRLTTRCANPQQALERLVTSWAKRRSQLGLHPGGNNWLPDPEEHNQVEFQQLHGETP